MPRTFTIRQFFIRIFLYFSSEKKTDVKKTQYGGTGSVADPHRKNADPDPGKNLNADADPDADSCP